MRKDLFALERRFERRVLYVFQAIVVVVAISAIMRGDWWLLGICIGAFFLNGLIGGGLQKNRHKSFSQLAAGSAGEAEMVSEKADSEDFDTIARSATKFTYLVVLTTIVIVHHLGQPWWGIIGAAVTAWGASVILPMLVVERPS
jgi:hypothetical protein